MRPGDRIVYWRSKTGSSDGGGIVGTGYVVTPELTQRKSGISGVETRVNEFFDDQPVNRDEVLARTGLNDEIKMWSFSLRHIPRDYAEKIDGILRVYGRQGIFPPDDVPVKNGPAGETVFLSDSPQRDQDMLGRMDLAFLLAGRLNLIWDEMNKSDTSDEKARTSPGFVVHVDAPWGGGKTSFANYLSLVLNPYRVRDGRLPSILEALPLNDENSWPEKFRRPWHIVMFNAWQRQHVDPPWWCFYQSIRKQIFEAQAFERNEQQLNPAIPQPNKAFAHPNELLREVSRFWNWATEASWKLFTPQFVKSGLTTLIAVTVAILFYNLGFLEAVLNKDNNSLDFGDWSAAVSAVLAILIGGGSFLWTISATMSSSLLSGSPEAAKNYSLGGGDPLERFRQHFAKVMRAAKRPVLVIVDDLDRCEPDFVVELVRGMQTILTSPRVVFLILGDRDWIEQAFAKTHDAMKDINVGDEHSFGGRFVEKAIQLSIVLPDATDDERADYVRALLGVGHQQSNSEDEVPREQSTFNTFSKIIDAAEREAKAAEKREEVLDDESIALDDKQRILKDLDRAMALRSAADPSAEAAIRHRLEPLCNVLPNNPRQIKRIINVIAFLQESARLRLQVQPQTQRWRQLALWTVLMTEWPQTWAKLAQRPELATLIHKSPQPDLSSSEATGDSQWSIATRSKADVMALLDYPSTSEADDEWADARIDAEAVRFLNRIVQPAGAGQ